MFGLAIASLQRITQLDELRHAVERMDPAHYLTSSYYERWLSALATLLVEKGIMAREAVPDMPLGRPAASPHEPSEPSAPVAVGDRVRVRDLHARGHTRCPRYVRGRCGTVVHVDREAALPDQAAHARTARTELTYAVRPAAPRAAGRRCRARRRLRLRRPLAQLPRAGTVTGPHPHDAPPSAIEQRVATLEALLTDKGLVNAEFLDAIVRSYENDIGPRNGARVVARAWTDPEYQQRLLAEGTPAIAELGFGGPEGQHVVVVENRPSVHNVIVCTLCSCYPWALLGLPPVWYKSPPYRARMVREPRAVLREMGLELADDVEIRVWDSSAEIRYLVLPQRPAGTEDLDEEQLTALVTRDGMVGVAAL